MADTMILGLRLAVGIDAREFLRRHGRDLRAVYGSIVDEFVGYGLLEATDTRVRLTPRGRLLSNELFQRLLPEPVS
jgi:oxygen-independent coproporphyrinogen-3 oxidase